MTGTAGIVGITCSIAVEAGTWTLCADVMFQSTQASKTLDSCPINISPQTIQLSPADYGFYQTDINMLMPMVGKSFKPGAITRLYQGPYQTFYLICNLLCVTPVNVIRPFTVNYTATRIT